MPEILTPPRGASLLLRLLAGETDFPQIEGDLSEEFHQRVLSAGAAAARQWYRHEALRNTWVLARTSKTLRTMLAAGLGAVGLCWGPQLLYLGQHIVQAVVGAIVMHQPLWPFVSKYFWAAFHLRGTPFAIGVPPFDPWVVPLFRAVTAFCFGILATRSFTDRAWLLRLAFVGWTIALWVYFPLNPLLYGVWWFLLGSAYCSRRVRRQLAV